MKITEKQTRIAFYEREVATCERVLADDTHATIMPRAHAAWVQMLATKRAKLAEARS